MGNAHSARMRARMLESFGNGTPLTRWISAVRATAKLPEHGCTETLLTNCAFPSPRAPSPRARRTSYPTGHDLEKPTVSWSNGIQVARPFATFAALLEPCSTVLDAGCGPGRDLARFAAQGHTGIGIDLNRDFVDRARAHGPVILGDLRALPLRAAAFDAVWASASLIHLPHEGAAVALREFARVARPGAPVSVSVKTAGVTGWADDMPRGRRWFSTGTLAISPERSRPPECPSNLSRVTMYGSKSQHAGSRDKPGEVRHPD